MMQIPAYRVVMNDHRMRADNIENQLGWKKPPVVLAQGDTVILRKQMSQSAFVFDPTLKSEGAQDPFRFVDDAKRREPFAYRSFCGFLPKGKHPIKVKRSALQMCLLLGCRNEGMGCDGVIYVNSFGLQGFAKASKRAIVVHVKAFLPTVESDSNERNSDR